MQIDMILLAFAGLIIGLFIFQNYLELRELEKLKRQIIELENLDI